MIIRLGHWINFHLGGVLIDKEFVEFLEGVSGLSLRKGSAVEEWVWREVLVSQNEIGEVGLSRWYHRG